MKKELENIQPQLMQDPLSNHLWLQKQDLETRMQHVTIKQEVYGPESTKKLDSIWR